MNYINHAAYLSSIHLIGKNTLRIEEKLILNNQAGYFWHVNRDKMTKLSVFEK